MTSSAITVADLRRLQRLPANRRRGPSARTLKESSIVHGVVRLMKLHPKVAWVARMNTGSARLDDKRTVRFGFVGCSDVVGQLVDGRFIAFECKTATGRVTAEQRAFLERVTKHHGLAAVVRSITEADQILMREPLRVYAPR